MRLYLASTPVSFQKVRDFGGDLSSANILLSYAYMNDFARKRILPVAKNFILDSGAFTFVQKYTSPDAVNWDAYADEYSEFIVDNDIKRFFELDIDSLVGLSRVEELRERLESNTGRKSIPVFHKPRGKQYFIDMCKEYDYVSIGGYAGFVDTSPKDKKYFPWFTKTAHEHGARIHGLGFTPGGDVLKYGFDSVDSSSWTVAFRYGAGVPKFDGRRMKNIEKPDGWRRCGEYGLLARRCFDEWVKFSQYLEEPNEDW